MKKKPYTVSLDPSILEALSKRAASVRMSSAEFVRELLHEELVLKTATTFSPRSSLPASPIQNVGDVNTSNPDRRPRGRPPGEKLRLKMPAPEVDISNGPPKSGRTSGTMTLADIIRLEWLEHQELEEDSPEFKEKMALVERDCGKNARREPYTDDQIFALRQQYGLV